MRKKNKYYNKIKKRKKIYKIMAKRLRRKYQQVYFLKNKIRGRKLSYKIIRVIRNKKNYRNRRIIRGANTYARKKRYLRKIRRDLGWALRKNKKRRWFLLVTKRKISKKKKKVKIRKSFRRNFRISRTVLNFRAKCHRQYRKNPGRKVLDLAEAIVYKKCKFYKRKKETNRRKKIVNVSSRVSMSLFALNYDMLLNYHAPIGKRVGEWRPGVQLTNIMLIRNQITILNITTIFFELRKALNRVFKALKLRKGVALLNGRRYSWRRLFTFVFSRWLPGFFTNFWINVNEIISYFYKRRCLTRRQRSRLLAIKFLNYDKKFLKLDKRGKGKNLIRFTKLPTASISVIDNVCWLRECLKEGISTIQLSDSSSQIEKLDYPLISNQSSIAFLSFITLLFKELCYQARFWEIKNFRSRSYYRLNTKSKTKKKGWFKKLLKKWVKTNHYYNKLWRRSYLVRSDLKYKKKLYRKLNQYNKAVYGKRIKFNKLWKKERKLDIKVNE